MAWRAASGPAIRLGLGRRVVSPGWGGGGTSDDAKFPSTVVEGEAFGHRGQYRRIERDGAIASGRRQAQRWLRAER